MPENPPLWPATGPRRSSRSRRVALLLVPGLVLATGCLYKGKEATDETVQSLAAHPYDQLPEQLRERSGNPGSADPAATETSKTTPARTAPNDTVPTDVQTVAYMAGAQDGKTAAFQLTVPEAIPGSEAPLLTLPAEPAARLAALRKMYAPLPPLEPEVQPLPGPNGKPYTLSDLQRLAAENSPTLRQAAADVQAARGSLLQSAAYANPNVSLQEQPSNNSSTSAAFGFAIDQVISTGGKQRLQVAQAKKQVDNAELALKKARSDLATQVRNAYYAHLVAKETMRVTRALAVLTDEVYRVQLAYTEKLGQSAAYEPAALRAQAWSARLAYKQAIATYIYAWKTLVSAIGERQLPLTEVSGRIDAVVPYYEYDRVLDHVLRNHTDAQTALNGIDIQRFNLKYNQVLPYMPNLDFNVGMFKDQALFPFGTYVTFTVSAPIPVWDQNRGNILSAEAALARSIEEPHRVEMALTSSLATNYANYRTNLDAVEYYRRYVLPDQVVAYRGTILRRQIDVTAQFGDLVAAQQALATSVTTYLGLLGTLWTSVVSVADLLQTDDLFKEAGEVRSLPALPDLESLPPLPGCHPYAHGAAVPGTCGPTMLPAPTPVTPVTPMPSPARPSGTPMSANGTGAALVVPVATAPMSPTGPAPSGVYPKPQATGGAYLPPSAPASPQPAALTVPVATAPMSPTGPALPGVYPKPQATGDVYPPPSAPPSAPTSPQPAVPAATYPQPAAPQFGPGSAMPSMPAMPATATGGYPMPVAPSAYPAPVAPHVAPTGAMPPAPTAPAAPMAPTAMPALPASVGGPVPAIPVVANPTTTPASINPAATVTASAWQPASPSAISAAGGAVSPAGTVPSAAPGIIPSVFPDGR